MIGYLLRDFLLLSNGCYFSGLIVIKLGDSLYVTSLHAVTYYVGEVCNKSTINLICRPIIYFIFYNIYFGLLTVSGHSPDPPMTPARWLPCVMC